MVAILPAAGKGTRMAAISKGTAKELLPVGGKPVLAWVIEECKAAGIAQIVAVVSHEKPAVVDFLSGKTELVYQTLQNGHGAAVAAPEICADVLVANPDTIFYPRSPVKRLKEAIENGCDVALAVERVPEGKVSHYGIVEFDEQSQITRILEKPNPTETTSRFAIAGRFGLSSKAFAFLRKEVADYKGGGEISLTRILAKGVAEGALKGLAIPLEPHENRLDCGDPEGYAHAQEVVGAH